jgi:hypothetical protein
MPSDIPDQKAADPRIRKRPSLFLRFAIVLLILFLLVFQYILFQRVSGKRDLEAWQAEMREKGERFTLKEIGLTSSDYNEAPALVLKEASQRLKGVSSKVASGGGYRIMKIVAPGKAASLLDKETIPDWAVNGPAPKPKEGWSWGILSNELSQARIHLKPVHDQLAVATPVFPYDYSKAYNAKTPHFGILRSLARWFGAEAQVYLKNGEINEAMRVFSSLKRLTKTLKEERAMIAQLIRISIGGVWQSLTWQLLQCENLSDSQLRDLQSMWSEEEEWFDDLTLAIEMERVMNGIAYDQLRSRDGGLFFQALVYPSSITATPTSSSTEGYKDFVLQAARNFHFFVWRNAWLEQDLLRNFHAWQAFLAASRELGRNKSYREASLLGEKLLPPEPSTWLGELKFPTADEPATLRILLSLSRHETSRQFILASIALKRYHLRHRRHPIKLDDLVPEYLDSVPLDIVAGGVLQYRPNPDGTYTLYSIGENGVDDGGDPTGPNWYEGKDWIWPWPASDKEIESYK